MGTRLVYFALVSAALASVVFTVVATIKNKGWILFSWHPILMSVGCACCAVGSVQFFTPVSTIADRIASRPRHRVYNYIGVVSVVGGVVGIVASRVDNNKSLWPHNWHSWLGVLAVVMVVLQVFSGAQKAGRVKTVIEYAPRMHAKVGMAVLAALTVALVTGMFKSFNKPDPAVNDFKSALGVSVLAIIYTLAALFMSSDVYKAMGSAQNSSGSTSTSVAYSPVNTTATDDGNGGDTADSKHVTKVGGPLHNSALDRKPFEYCCNN